MRIEHIGIAVQNAEQSQKLFTKLLGTGSYKTEEVASEGVSTIFFGIDNTKIELLQSISADSAIDKYINKKGEGIHHIAFEVDDIDAEVKRLKEEGFLFVNETPKPGADHKLICFLHPKSTNGVLVELCQEVK